MREITSEVNTRTGPLPDRRSIRMCSTDDGQVVDSQNGREVCTHSLRLEKDAGPESFGSLCEPCNDGPTKSERLASNDLNTRTDLIQESTGWKKDKTQKIRNTHKHRRGNQKRQEDTAT
jgi:hypothetical protein